MGELLISNPRLVAWGAECAKVGGKLHRLHFHHLGPAFQPQQLSEDKPDIYGL